MTRHDVVVQTADGILTIPPCGQTVRSASARRVIEPIKYDGHIIQCSQIVYGNIKLPPEEPCTGIIISAICASELRNLGVRRNDIYTVDQTVRDPITHEVCGCAGLIKW